MPLDEKDVERMERQIREAFRGVTREGGVSWIEAGAIDERDDEETCRAARALDEDQSWEELVEDPSWDPNSSWGGFSFLDPIGFRYYLAPAMIRAMRSDDLHSICHYLNLKDSDPRHAEWIAHKHSLLNHRQRQCVAQFLAFMCPWTRGRCILLSDRWRETFESGWDKVVR